jgi:hypothetical protein
MCLLKANVFPGARRHPGIAKAEGEIEIGAMPAQCIVE